MHGNTFCVKPQLYSLFSTNRVLIVIKYSICIGNNWRDRIFTSLLLYIPTRNLHIYEQIPVFVERLQGACPSRLYMNVRVLSISARLVKIWPTKFTIARISCQFYCIHAYTCLIAWDRTKWWKPVCQQHLLNLYNPFHSRVSSLV